MEFLLRHDNGREIKLFLNEDGCGGSYRSVDGSAITVDDRGLAQAAMDVAYGGHSVAYIADGSEHPTPRQREIAVGVVGHFRIERDPYPWEVPGWVAPALAGAGA